VILGPLIGPLKGYQKDRPDGQIPDRSSSYQEKALVLGTGALCEAMFHGEAGGQKKPNICSLQSMWCDSEAGFLIRSAS